MPPNGEPPPGPTLTEEAAKSAPRRPREARALIVLCCAVIAAALVAGAAGVRSGNTDDNALRGFQIRVLSITQAAAENRTDGALAALQALEKDLGEAATAGRVSAARYRGIETALGAVRADIATQVAASAASSGTQPDTIAVSPESADTAQDAPAPAEPAVPAVAPAPPTAPEAPGSQRSDAAKDAKGKGKGQGKP